MNIQSTEKNTQESKLAQGTPAISNGDMTIQDQSVGSTQKVGCNSEHRFADSVPSISVKQDLNANSALTIPAVLETSKI